MENKMVTVMRLGVLFSGGKDSTYACGRAMEAEEVVCLITVKSLNQESYMFHTPNLRWVRFQAEAVNLPLVEVESEGIEEEELHDLTRAIMQARDLYAIEGVVTGAILSVYQATRIQKICRDLDLWCFSPLWYTDQASYMQRLLETGFRILVSGVFSAPFDESWLGKTLDRNALRELISFSQTYGITLSGEGGEYETFVIDAPFFRKRIQVMEASTEYRNYHGRYNITAARLVEK